MRRRILLAALVMTAVAGCQTVLSNGPCNPEYAAYTFGNNSTWVMSVGAAGCQGTIDLNDAFLDNSAMVTNPANGNAFVMGVNYGYQPNVGFVGKDQFQMSLTGRGPAGAGTSIVTVQVQVSQ